MIRKSSFFLALLAVGCATTYQPEGVFNNGYSNHRLTDDVYVVTFRANEFTSEEKALEYALRRSAEVARKKGYHYFVVLEKMTYLHSPSVRMKIQCFVDRPEGVEEVFSA